MEYCTPLVITYFAINWCFCVNFVFHQKSDEPIPLENQPHTAPKEEKVRLNLKPNPLFGSLQSY